MPSSDIRPTRHAPSMDEVRRLLARYRRSTVGHMVRSSPAPRTAPSSAARAKNP